MTPRDEHDDGGVLTPFPEPGKSYLIPITPTGAMSPYAGRPLRELVPPFLSHKALVERCAPLTVRAYGQDLKGFIAFCEQVDRPLPGDVNIDVIEFWMGAVLSEQQHLAETSINRKLQALRALWKWLLRYKLVADDPTRLVRRVKEPKRLPTIVAVPRQDSMLRALASEASPLGLRDFAMIAAGFLAGLRRSELARLEVKHVDFDGGWLYVRQGKNRKDRPVPLAPTLEAALRRYLEHGRPVLLRDTASPYVFLRGRTWRARAGQPLGGQAIYRAIRDALRRVGYEDAYPHLLRHGFAGRVREHDGGLQDLQEAMGHADPKTTARYASLTSRSRRERFVRFIEGDSPPPASPAPPAPLRPAASAASPRPALRIPPSRRAAMERRAVKAKRPPTGD